MNGGKIVVEKKLQWHPAFYAGIQIEFEEEAKELVFESEHQLGTKPKEVDVLITKKNSNYQVKKNIGRFFRKYNLIEYKPPGDTLTIDDFYKACGYACFYKADSAFVNAIGIDEITVTLVSYHYPREMIKCLKEEKRYQISEVEKGIYSIDGGIFPIQFIVTRRVDEENNFWLKNLTNELKSTEKVCEKYKKYGRNELYRSVMDIIIDANKSLFMEGYDMSEALFEIYKERLMKMAIKEAMEIVEPKAQELAEAKAQELAEVKAQELAEAKAQELAEVKILEKQKLNIMNLMKTTNITLEKALDALMIPEEERILYKFS